MKKTLRFLATFLTALSLIPSSAFAINVTVPSAPSTGYVLTSSNVNTYTASSTNNLTIGNLIATSTTATSTFSDGIKLTGGCFLYLGNCLTSGGSTASTTLLIDNNTFGGTNIFSNAASNFAGTWQGFSPAHFLTANQTITLSGDITGSGVTAITTTLATVNANVGSFTNANVTVNGKGLVTAVSNGSASGSTFGYPFTPGTFGATVTAATSTAINDTGGFISTASSTLSLLTVTNGTTTNATSTNVYVSGQSIFAATSGNVGISTTTPQQSLSIGGNTPEILLMSSSANPAIVFSKSGGQNGQITGGGNNLNLFGGVHTATADLTINALGNIGIGSTSPSSRLDILSTLNNQTPLLNIASSTNGTGTTSAFFVGPQGNVGINTSAPLATLDVKGLGTGNLQNLLVESDPGGTGSGGINSITFSNNDTTNYKNQFSLRGGAGYTERWAIGNDVQGNASNNMYVYNDATGETALFIDSAGNLQTMSNTGIGFNNSATIGTSGSIDTMMSRGGAGIFDFGNGSQNNTSGTLLDATEGVGTSTPTAGTIGIGNTGTNTILLRPTATSTFGSGININSGCFAINGSCLTSSSNFFSNSGASTYLSTGTNLGVGTTTPFGMISTLGASTASTTFTAWGIQTTSSLITTVTTFNSNGNWTVPANLVSVSVTAVGAGGGGGQQNSVNQGGSGGGSTAFGSLIVADGGGGGCTSGTSVCNGAHLAGGAPGTSSSGGAGASGSANTLSGGGGGAQVASSTVSLLELPSAGNNVAIVIGIGGSSGTGGGSSVGGSGYFSGGSTSNHTGAGGAGSTGNGQTGSSSVGGVGGTGGSFGGTVTPGAFGSGDDGSGGASGSGAAGGAANSSGTAPGGGSGGIGNTGGQASVGGNGQVVVTAITLNTTNLTVPTLTIANDNETQNGVTYSTPDVLFQGIINFITYVFQKFDQWGHLVTGGPVPTCGTGCNAVSGDDRTMRVTTGTGVTAVTVNFSHAYNATPVCVSSDESGGTTVSDASSTPSSVTMNLSASLTTKSIGLICQVSSNFTF